MGATKPMCHNYWTCALEPVSHDYWARMLQLLKPARLRAHAPNKRSYCNEKSMYYNYRKACSPQLEKSLNSNEDPAQPKLNKIKIIKKNTGYWSLSLESPTGSCLVSLQWSLAYKCLSSTCLQFYWVFPRSISGWSYGNSISSFLSKC